MKPIYKPKGRALRRSITSHGYVIVRFPNHPNAFVSGYVYEHRLIMEGVIGRLLDRYEIVHHIDGNKQNNSPDNLALVASIANHKAEHRHNGSKLRLPGEKNPLIKCACGCGEFFLKYDESGRPRVFVSGHNQRRPAVQLSGDGSVIRAFPGARAAGKETGICGCSIAQCCNGKRKSAGNFQWRYCENETHI